MKSMSNTEDEKQKVLKQPKKDIDIGKEPHGFLQPDQLITPEGLKEYHPGSHIQGVPTESPPPR